jgi:hypothetical protein
MAEKDPTNANDGGEQSAGLGDGKTFTQSDLERVLNERLQRERAKYADYDDLKTKVQQMEDAQKSELERAMEAREAAEQKAREALAQANERLIRAEFVSQAAIHGVAHPEDAFRLADRQSVTIGDDGAVTGVTEAVKALVEAGRLVMSGGPRAPNLDGGAGGGDRASDKKLQLTPEEEEIAKKMNIPLEKYAEFRRKE